jgi:hypothetical protein
MPCIFICHSPSEHLIFFGAATFLCSDAEAGDAKEALQAFAAIYDHLP